MAIDPRWLNEDFKETISLFQKWLYDIFLFKMTKKHHFFESKKENIKKLSEAADITKLLNLLKSVNNIKLYLVFDIYFSNGIDFRERIFIRTEEDMAEGDNFKEKSRLEELEDMINGNQSGMNLKKEEILN